MPASLECRRYFPPGAVVMGGVVEHCKRMVVFISALFREARHRLCNAKLQADGSAKARTKQDIHTHMPMSLRQSVSN